MHPFKSNTILSSLSNSSSSGATNGSDSNANSNPNPSSISTDFPPSTAPAPSSPTHSDPACAKEHEVKPPAQRDRLNSTSSLSSLSASGSFLAQASSLNVPSVSGSFITQPSSLNNSLNASVQNSPSIHMSKQGTYVTDLPDAFFDAETDWENSTRENSVSTNQGSAVAHFQANKKM